MPSPVHPEAARRQRWWWSTGWLLGLVPPRHINAGVLLSVALASLLGNKLI